MYNTYQYIIANDGITTDNSYPFIAKVCIHSENSKFSVKNIDIYTIQQSSCGFNKKNVGARMSGVVAMKPGDEGGLQAAVASVGPVAVAVDGRNKAFRVGHL